MAETNPKHTVRGFTFEDDSISVQCEGGKCLSIPYADINAGNVNFEYCATGGVQTVQQQGDSLTLIMLAPIHRYILERAQEATMAAA